MKRLLLTSLALTMTIMAAAAEKPRVYVTESGAVQQFTGDASLGDSKGNILLEEGTSPHNIEVLNNFVRHCPEVVVTGNRAKADYLVRLDRDEISPFSPFIRGNKVAVFDKNDELIHSNTTRKLGNAVKSACAAIVGKAARTAR